MRSLQTEFAFAGRRSECLREWLQERRKTRLRRFGDWCSTRLLLPFLQALLALVESSKLLRIIPGPVWTIGSMLISIAIYSSRLGWKMATGFIILLLVHEFGHLLAARYYRVQVSAPLFVPFCGAIIDMKEPTRNAWEEAVFGISGPLLGTLGACLCWVIAGVMHSFFFAELAFFGCFLNLFNLIPLGELDGGHIAVALTRWLWVPGLLIMGAFVWFIHAPAAILMLVVMLPMVIGLFRKRSPSQRVKQDAYDRISLPRRFLMGALYLGLVAFLVTSMGWIFAKDIHFPKMTPGESLGHKEFFLVR